MTVEAAINAEYHSYYIGFNCQTESELFQEIPLGKKF